MDSSNPKNKTLYWKEVDGKAVPADSLEEAVASFEKNMHVIKQTKLKEPPTIAMVSTIFLWINANPDWPACYETMVLGLEGVDEQYRSFTREEALRIHDLLVEMYGDKMVISLDTSEFSSDIPPTSGGPIGQRFLPTT